MLDAGEVGTEMLYFLVGSRELDGGLMCTASHNPKAYTGAKLVERGAIALSGDAGIGDIRAQRSTSRPRRRRRGGGSVEEVDAVRGVPGGRARVHRPRARSSRCKVVVDGGNGMAGPMVGPLLERLGLELVETYWTPDGNFPDHEPNPLLPENREFIIAKVRRPGRRPRHRLGRRRRPLLLHRRHGRVRRRRLPHRAARRVAAAQAAPARAILYDVRASRAVADTVERAGGTALVNRVGHAFFKTRMREEGSLFGGEVSGHYYFRDFYCADSGTIPALLILELLSQRGRRDVRAARALPRALLHLRRDQLRGRRPAGQDARRSPSATPTPSRTASTASRSTTRTGTSTCARRTPSRCCACAWSRCVSREDMERRRDEVLALIRS